MKGKGETGRHRKSWREAILSSDFGAHHNSATAGMVLLATCPDFLSNRMEFKRIGYNFTTDLEYSTGVELFQQTSRIGEEMNVS